MKLEQTMQKTSKDPGGIIGEQQKGTYSAEWNLIFHESHLIDDLFHNLTRSKIRYGRDTNINHRLIETSKSENFSEMASEQLTHFSPVSHFYTP